MNKWYISELSSSSSDLSLADDCESLKSAKSSVSSLPLQPLLLDYKLPLFTKVSGEKILLLTNLYLPLKRPREENEILNSFEEHIRKNRGFKYQLLEFFEETNDIEEFSINDGLLQSRDNYLKNYLESLEKNIEENQSGIKDVFKDKEEEKIEKIPLVKLIDLEHYKDPPRKKFSKSTSLIFQEKSAISNPNNNLIEIQDNLYKSHNGFPSLFPKISNLIPRLSFCFTTPQPQRLKIQPGLLKNPFNPPPNTSHWGEKANPPKNTYYSTLPPYKFLKFTAKAPPKDMHNNKLPSVHELNSLIFSDKSDSFYNYVKSNLSKFQPLPIIPSPPPESKSEDLYSYEDYSSSSENEEPESAPLSIPPKDPSLPNHAKFAYKHHLLKTLWSPTELLRLHRPVLTIASPFLATFKPPIPPPQHLQEDPYSYTKFKKLPDLSLESGDFILTEYIEKYPLLLQSPGMASKVHCYYTDTSPAPPYMGDLGTAQPSQCYPSIRSLTPRRSLAFFENTLFVSPIFSHKSASRDYLLVHTSSNTWCIRDFCKVYTLGQQEPRVEIPAPKSKVHRETKDKHIAAVIYHGLLRGNNSLTLAEIQKLTKGMHSKNLKSMLGGLKIVGAGENYCSERILNKSDAVGIISPEVFCAYQALMEAKARMEMKGISIVNSEGIAKAVSVIFNEFEDRKIKYLAGVIEETVALAPWNLSCCYLRGKKRKIFQIKGRGDPTCGYCGYSFEIIPKAVGAMIKESEEMIKDIVKKEIKLLGKSTHHENSSDESEICNEYYDLLDSDTGVQANTLLGDKETNEEQQLQELISTIAEIRKQEKPNETLSKTVKVLKRKISYPTLDGSFRRKIQYITSPQEINNYYSKKPSVMPKIFQTKPKISGGQLQKKILESEEKKIKRLLESEKRKKERKLEKVKEKLIRQQEWKTICMEKYESGAVFFNTGTNSNIRCSACNMIGHRSGNKKLCPAYIEETLDLNSIGSKITLNMNEIQNEDENGTCVVTTTQKKGGSKTKKIKNKKSKPIAPPVREEPKRQRREVDEFQEVIVRIIETEKNKVYIKKENGLMSMLEKCEKGYKWNLEEFISAIQDLFGEDYVNHREKIENIIRKREPPPEIEKKEKKEKKKQHMEIIEEDDTLIINF